MANYKQDILEFVGSEDIEAIVIGKIDWGSCRAEWNVVWEHVLGKVISWEIAEELLDFEYDSDYSAPECPAVNIWTETKVIFLSQYDGTSWFEFVYRNPADCRPKTPGG